MSAPQMIPIALTFDQTRRVFGRAKLRGGAGQAIIKARHRIDPMTGAGEMLPQCLEECRLALGQLRAHRGTYQTILRILIAAGEKGQS